MILFVQLEGSAKKKEVTLKQVFLTVFPMRNSDLYGETAVHLISLKRK